MTEPLSERALRRLLAMAAEDDASVQLPLLPVLPDRYEIVREIGRGGMGVVYEVIDRQLARRCALKTLGSGAGADEEARRRFAREARAAARLSHPHIATVHDATPDYISMQLVAGGPIHLEPRDDPRRLVALVRDAALALHYAHEQGLVHRDLKPSNLLVENGHVFVVDFGLAKQIDANTSLSSSGALVGTPAFMPPEQALGQNDAIDARSDVYGLAATLFCCLRGEPPFAAPALPILLRRVVEDEAPSLRVDADLDLVVAKCLAKDREQRYATMRAFADDLQRWLQHEPVLARRPSLRYRWKKRLQRQRAVLRAVAIAAMVAAATMALVFVPIWWRENVARSAASEAVALSGVVGKVLQDAALFSRLGDAESSAQELDRGIARVRAFLQRHEVPQVRYLLGRLLHAHGLVDDALAELERTVTAAPDLADARFERGLRLASLASPTPEQVTTAVADLRVPLGDGSVVRDVDRLLGRAELARLTGDPQRAMELLREVLEYDSLNVDARLSLVRTCIALGLGSEATRYSASAIDLRQGYGPFYLAREQRGLPTTMLGLDGLLVDFSNDLRGGADDSVARSHRGIVQLRRALRLADEGRLAEAIDAAVAAVADHEMALGVHHDRSPAGLRVDHAVCSMVLDRLRSENGDTALAVAARAEARRELERALELAPTLPEVHGNLGVLALREARLLLSLGRLAASEQRADAARAAFTRALDLAPADWPHAAFCRERLVALASPPGDAK